MAVPPTVDTSITRPRASAGYWRLNDRGGTKIHRRFDRVLETQEVLIAFVP